MEHKRYTVSELAGFFDITAGTLHLYERKGLLTPAQIDAGTGYRYYSIANFHQVHVILNLKSLGFPLGEIKAALAGEVSLTALEEKVRERRDAWDMELKRLRKSRKKLEAAISKLDAADTGLGIARLSGEQRAALLARLSLVGNEDAREMLTGALWL